MRRRFRLVLAGAFALLAVTASVAYGNSVREEAQAARNEALERYGGEVVSVVVAAEALEAGTELGPSNCAEREWLVDLVPEGAATSLEAVTGTALTSPVSKGSPITDASTRTSVDRLEIPDGHVALSVPVNERTGVGPATALGSRLTAYRVEDGATRLVAPSLLVIGAPATGTSLGGALTVAVPADDVAALIAAVADGTLRLVEPADDVEGGSAEGGAATGGDAAGETAAAADVPPEPARADDASKEGAPAEGSAAEKAAGAPGAAEKAAP